MAGYEGAIRVEREGLRTNQPCLVVVEGEDFTRAALLAVQFSHESRLPEMVDVGIDLNGIERAE